MTKAEEMQDYVNFMYNIENEFKCDKCPENAGFAAWPGHRLPYGQFHCWVTCHCACMEDNK